MIIASRGQCTTKYWVDSKAVRRGTVPDKPMKLLPVSTEAGKYIDKISKPRTKTSERGHEAAPSLRRESGAKWRGILPPLSGARVAFP